MNYVHDLLQVTALYTCSQVSVLDRCMAELSIDRWLHTLQYIFDLHACTHAIVIGTADI